VILHFLTVKDDEHIAISRSNAQLVADRSVHDANFHVAHDNLILFQLLKAYDVRSIILFRIENLL